MQFKHYYVAWAGGAAAGLAQVGQSYVDCQNYHTAAGTRIFLCHIFAQLT